jgi:hypothetical protein
MAQGKTKKPAKEESDYFGKLEQEKLSKLAAQRADREVAEAAETLRKKHWMRCAKCGNVMETMGFRGVEIERCPGCGGVYLDKGELEILAGKDRSGFFGNLSELLGLREPDES